MLNVLPPAMAEHYPGWVAGYRERVRPLLALGADPSDIIRELGRESIEVAAEMRFGDHDSELFFATITSAVRDAINLETST